jgi:hypothetical protein
MCRRLFRGIFRRNTVEEPLDGTGENLKKRKNYYWVVTGLAVHSLSFIKTQYMPCSSTMRILR